MHHICYIQRITHNYKLYQSIITIYIYIYIGIIFTIDGD